MRDAQALNAHSLSRARLAMALTHPKVGGLIGVVIVAAAVAKVFGPLGYLNDVTWLWLLIWGLGCVMLQVIALLNDPEEGRRLLRDLLDAETNIAAIHDPEITRMVGTAIEYRLDIARFETNAATAVGGHLADTVAQMTHWLEGIARLAHHVDGFRIGARQHASAIVGLRRRIDGLEERARDSTDRALIQQLRETIAGRRHQLRVAEEEASLNERAALRLEQAVAALGTMSLQLAMVVRKNEEFSTFDTVRSDINSEIEAVDQLLVAYDRTSKLSP